jgi:tetratricopeptide (TPR) repeat protein
VNLGVLYAKTDRPEEALDQYERALELEPNLAVLHSNKAAALVMLGRWEEAEQAGRRAVQLDPGSIDGNYMLGIAMMNQGKITPETAAHLAIAVKTHRGPVHFLRKCKRNLQLSRESSNEVAETGTPVSEDYQAGNSKFRATSRRLRIDGYKLYIS